MKTMMQSGCLTLAAAVLGLALTACGGGGGGGDDSVSLDDQAFTGVRTQATFTVANAEGVVLGTLDGRDIGGITPMGAAPGGGTLDLTGSAPRDLAAIARSAAEQAWQAVPQVRPAALLNPADECLNYPAGTLTDTLVQSSGASTASVSGTITYSNCDVGGVVMTGATPVAATFNLVTGDLVLALTFQNVQADDGVESFALAGTLNASFSFPTATMTMNVTMTDAAGKTFWMKNFQLVETEEAAGVRGTWSGRFYHHDHGFVDVVTTEPIFIPSDPLSPTFDGRLDFIGAPQSRATLWLGVNEADYCINVFGVNGAHLGDLGTCAPQ